MSDSSGSILQLPSKANELSNVKLLIVTDSTNNIQAIANSLDAGKVEFTYDVRVATHLIHNSLQQKYNAIIYDYYFQDQDNLESLIEKIQLLDHLYSLVPIILITDVLGDELAVSLIQSGVNGYVLRKKISQLPKVLTKTLSEFTNKKTIALQQAKKIQRLKQDEQSWLKQKKISQAKLLNLEKRIQQLEQEKQSWLIQQQQKQENISHLNHELRSPIASIVGFARMLKEQYYGPLNNKQLQYASGILSSGEHLLALVKNYLDMVKIEANKQELDLERLAVTEICQAAIFIVEEKAKAKKLQLNLNLAQDIDFCIGDSLRLKQILINLLSNAIKFTEQGSITLQVTLKDGLLYFAVIDTGMGISAKNMAKLFKPFPQITRHHESTGLGLALSRKLAQLHGGDITVTSEPGKGSCFTLHIPQYQ